MCTIRLLLADDHPILRASLRLLLETQNDFELVGDANDGKQAVALAAELKPDVVLMDAAMPGLGGIEATKRIKSAVPEVRVLALSQYTDAGAVLGMIEAGAQGFVPKASEPRVLFDAIRAVAAGGTYLGADLSGPRIESHLDQAARHGKKRGVWRLSPREREVVQLIAEGLSIKETAEALDLSPRTVETHRQHIMSKLGIHSVAGLTKWAVRERLTGNEP